MAENLGASFSIDITNLKAGLAAANRAIRESESEFKAAAAGMGDWTKSQEGLEKRIATMNKAAEIQQAKVEALKKEYNRLISEGLDPTSAKATDLRIKINNETAALEKSKAEIEKQTTALAQMQAESKAAADKAETLTEKVERQESELQQLKNKYIDVATAQDKNSDEAKALAQKIGELSGDLKENRDKLKDASDAADDLDQSFEKAEKGGLASFAVAIGNLAANLISAAISKMKDIVSNTIEVGKTFEKSMSNVQAISGATADEMQLLNDTAKEFGSSTQFSASEAADALGYMALAGWDAKTSASALGGVLDLAAASGMELAGASDMVTDYMSAFNITADKSAYFADVLAYAQGNANTTAAGLGEAFKNCAANLNAAGQDFETTTALLSQMANQGLKGSEAGTALTAVMRDMTAKMKDGKIAIGKTSVEVMDANGNYRDMTDILADVEKAVGGMGDAERATALQSTFTSDSIKGLNLILNAGVDKAAKFEKELRNSGGTAQKMAKIMNDNLGGDLTSLSSKFEGIQIALYEKFEPALRKAVEALSGLLDAVSWLVDHGGEVTAVITGIAAAVGTYVAYTTALQVMKNGWMSLAIVQKAVAAGQAVLNAVMSANPIGLIIAAVAGLVAAFVVLWNKSEKFRNFWIGLWNKIKETAEPIIKALSEWFAKAWDKIKEVWGKVSAWFADIFGKIKKTFEPVGNIISGYFEMGWKNIKVVWDLAVKYFKTIWENIKLVFSAVKSVLSGDFSGAWDSIKKIFGNTGKFFGDVWDGIKKVFSNTGEFFGKTFSGAKDKMTGAFSKIGDWFKSNWKSIIAFIINPFAGVFKYLYDNSEKFRNFVDKIVGKIKNIFKPIANWFKTKVTDPIKNFFTTAWNIIRELATGCWNAIKAVWSVVSGWFKSKVIEPIKAFFTTAWNIIKELATGCWNAIKAVWSVVSGWFRTKVIDPIKNFFTTAWNIIRELATGCWNAIKAVWSVVSEWFRTKVIEPIKTFFTNLWNGIKTAAQNAWNGIKTIWSTVSGWFNTTIIQPLQTFFTNLWNGIKTAAQNAWNGIKGIWGTVSGWFSDSVVTPVKNWFSGMWDKLKSGARDAWDGIKSVFGGVADWFKDKFSTAWQKVKDVFSTGGAVFDGIKDGIVSAFKTVVNAIIRGINRVIAIPFNAINNTLDKIRNVSIAGIEPFSGLISRFNVPQIPELAKGGVVRKATRAIIGEDGREAVVPLEKNTEWMNTLADKVADKVGGGVVVNQTNNYSQPHSRYEIYKSKQATAAAVKLALSR